MLKMGEKGVGRKEGVVHKGRRRAGEGQESGNGKGQNTCSTNPLFFISAAIGSLILNN